MKSLTLSSVDLQSGLEAAILVAREHVGATAPNPPVGAVILDADGKLLATGAHLKAGAPHAERAALTRLKDLGRENEAHMLIVTLEPCSHHGRTPPCTEAILASSIKEVLYAVSDPNPKVSGAGASLLNSAGITAMSASQLPELKLAHQSARQLVAPYLKWVTTGRPFVVLKVAKNEAGSMIPPQGQKTFTSPSSLKLAHELRRESDAILTGSGTVLADWPEFTVRHVTDHAGLKPRKIVVVDRRARLVTGQARDWIAERKRGGFEVWVETDLELALKRLGKAGCHQVLVEAGPLLVQTFEELKLWDRKVTIESRPDTDLVTDVWA